MQGIVNVSYLDKWNGDCVGLWNKQTYSRTRDLPGDTLVIAFFMHSYFSAKLQQMRIRFLLQRTDNKIHFRLRLQVTYCSDQLETIASNSGTAWSFWRGAHCIWLFNTLGAKSNKPQNLRLPYKLVDLWYISKNDGFQKLIHSVSILTFTGNLLN